VVAGVLGDMSLGLLAADEEDLYYEKGQYTGEMLRDLVGVRCDVWRAHILQKTRGFPADWVAGREYTGVMLRVLVGVLNRGSQLQASYLQESQVSTVVGRSVDYIVLVKMPRGLVSVRCGSVKCAV
jgi:hypothetical protein